MAINHVNILAIENGDDYNYFTCNTIETSSANNVGSVDFNSMRGKNVTELFKRTTITATQSGHQQFLDTFMKYLEGRNAMQIRINKNIQYILFSM